MSKPESTYDVIVVGAGPAGYVAAIRAAQLGLKTACVDHWTNIDGDPCLGGTYINAGCVSSMALLESAKIYDLMRHGLADHGISVDNIKLDLSKMIGRKNEKVARLSRQILNIFAEKKNQLLSWPRQATQRRPGQRITRRRRQTNHTQCAQHNTGNRLHFHRAPVCADRQRVYRRYDLCA